MPNRFESIWFLVNRVICKFKRDWCVNHETIDYDQRFLPPLPSFVPLIDKDCTSHCQQCYQPFF